MHLWGDDWFKENSDDLYAAIDYIEENLHKHNILVCGKEKYGTYRDEMLCFWDGSLHRLIYKRGWCSLNELENLIWKLDYKLIPYKKTKFGWLKMGFSRFPLRQVATYFYNKYQGKKYNETYQKACKKWPNVTDELLVFCSAYELIKPCKYGNVDGTEIHNKYWKAI